MTPSELRFRFVTPLPIDMRVGLVRRLKQHFGLASDVIEDPALVFSFVFS